MKLSQFFLVAIIAIHFGVCHISALQLGRGFLEKEIPDLNLPQFTDEKKVVIPSFSTGERDLKVDESYMSKSEYPWFSLLLKVVDHRLQWTGCAGSLVSKGFILTTATCINRELSAVWVGASTSAPGNDGQNNELIKIEDVIIHPSFDNVTYTANFALIKLAEKSTIDPVRLGSSFDIPMSEFISILIRISHINKRSC